MTSKPVALDLAAFLDAPQARDLVPGVRREDVHSIAETLFAISYDDLGKKPRLLDGEDTRAILEVFLPARLAPKDPRIEHVPAVLTAFFDHLEETQVVPHAYEARRGLEEHLDALLDLVRSGRNAERQIVQTPDPFVHRAAKLGRNDPCSCGSGKKYKKCHGKEA